MFAPGIRVKDKEGKKGIVVGEENGKIIVDCDSGLGVCSYIPDQLEEIDDIENLDLIQ